jgi:hypothetical protein
MNGAKVRMPGKAVLLATMLMLAGSGLAVGQLEVFTQGEPYANGSMTLNVKAPTQVGVPVLLVYGLSPMPLLQPIATGKGPFFVGSLLNVLGVGVIGSNGRLDVPFLMPPYSFPGNPVVVQAFVNGTLSNPATIPLDQPYFEPNSYTKIDHPLPIQQAHFGDRVAAGDLNGDGFTDLVANAWYESVNGLFAAGRVYVIWGPDWSNVTALQSEAPVLFQGFGASVTVRDFDKDGVDDLLTAKPNGGDPFTPGVHGYLYLYKGGQPFSEYPAVSMESAGTGYESVSYGRWLTVGDFNGDTWLDVAAAVPQATVLSKVEAGHVEVFWGPSYGSPSVIENPTPKASDFFGTELEAVDVNGDGITDLVESSGRGDGQHLQDSGVAHVFIGPTLTLSLTINNPLPDEFARFGEGLHAADLNGDGKAEVVVADVKDRLFICWAPAYDTFTLRRKPPAPAVNPFGDTSYGYFIDSTDANVDGIPDLVIADPFSGALTGCSAAAEGTVYVALGPYYSAYRVIYEPEPACGDEFAWGMILVDIDDDGRKEILTGAPTTELGSITNAGSLYVLWP